jgi:transposase
MAARLLVQLRHSQALNNRLTYENALLKRMKFAAQSERFNLKQKSLLEDEIDADIAAVAEEIGQLNSQHKSAPESKKQPKRQPLPMSLPWREIRHEPDATTCQCGCRMQRIGEDVAGKLHYVSGVFTVERHVCGKWACAQCETITQAPVDAHVLDKGIPTTGLLAQMLVGKSAVRLPLYRRRRALAALA